MGQEGMRKGGLVEPAKRIPGALRISFSAGELLFQAGAFAAGVYVVEAGLVVQGFYRDGRPRASLLASPGDLVGVEAWLAEPTPRYRAFARALTSTRVWFISSQDWGKALADPELQRLLLDQLAKGWLDRAVLHSLTGDPKRALAWLLWRWGEPKDSRLRLPANASLLASLAGCSRSAMGKALESLQKEGAVKLQPGWLLGLPDALRTYFFGEVAIASPR